MCPSVLFQWRIRGKQAQKVQQNSCHCLWVEFYPGVLSCLCSCTLRGGTKHRWCRETDQRTSNPQLFTMDRAAARTPGQVLGKDGFNLTASPELPRLCKDHRGYQKRKTRQTEAPWDPHFLHHTSESFCMCQPFTGSLVQTLSKCWSLPGICFREQRGQRLRKAFTKSTENGNSWNPFPCCNPRVF